MVVPINNCNLVPTNNSAVQENISFERGLNLIRNLETSGISSRFFYALMLIKVSYNLLFEAYNKGWHKEYAMFLFLKHKYSNSCIYNYNVNKLHKQTGISRGCIKRHVDLFLKKGMCEFHGKNLMFKSLDSITEALSISTTRKHTIKVKQFTRRDITDQLHLLLLKNKKQQVDFIIQKKVDRNNPKTSKDYKSALKFFKSSETQYDEKPNYEFNMSLYGLGKLFRCSRSMAAKIMKRLSLKNYIKTIRRYKVLAEHVPRKMLDLFPNGCYWSNGLIIKNKSNTIYLG